MDQWYPDNLIYFSHVRWHISFTHPMFAIQRLSTVYTKKVKTWMLGENIDAIPNFHSHVHPSHMIPLNALWNEVYSSSDGLTTLAQWQSLVNAHSILYTTVYHQCQVLSHRPIHYHLNGHSPNPHILQCSFYFFTHTISSQVCGVRAKQVKFCNIIFTSNNCYT